MFHGKAKEFAGLCAINKVGYFYELHNDFGNSMKLELPPTQDPLKDIPEDKRILFYDGCGIDIGYRKGEWIIYSYKPHGTEEFRTERLDVRWVQGFCEIQS